MKNWVTWEYAAWMLLMSGIVSAADTAPYKLTVQNDSYRPTGDMHVIDDRLVFSQFGASGNAYDIVSLDPKTLDSQVLVSERPEARFIASDKRFVVIQQKGDVARPVVVLDASSGRELGRVRLIQPVTWGRIEGERLLLVQGGWGGGRADVPALIYSLPTLKFVQSTTVTGGDGTRSWKDRVVSLGAELSLYDARFERLGTISLPPPLTRNNSVCGRQLHLVADDRAFITNGCGVINVVDLTTRSVVRVIEGPSYFYHLQLIGDTLFAADTGDGTSPEVRAYEPSSGKLIAQLPIDASSGMFAVGGRLIAQHHLGDSYSRFALQSFEVDLAALYRGDWQTERVAFECAEAQKILARSDDLYGAIERCREGGIDRLVGAESLTPSQRSLVLNYAAWLSRTFDEAGEAQRILAWLAETGTPVALLAKAQLDAAVRRKVITGQTGFESSEIASDLGRLIVPDAHSLSTTTVLDYQGQSLVMDGTLALAKRLACQALPCGTRGQALLVYDRTLMTELAAVEIPIRSEDGESERNISSIAADDQHVYVAVEDHWDTPKSSNLFVVDKQTWRVVNELLVPVKAQSVQIVDDTLLVCHCNYRVCQALARPTFELAPHAFVGCPDSSDSSDSSDLPVTRINGSRNRWRFTRLNGAGPMEIDFRQTLGKPLIGDAGTAAVFLEMNVVWSLAYVDFRDGATRTLLQLPRGNAMPVLTMHDSTLMLAYGRDLLLIDLRTKKLRRYLQSLIPGGFKNNGNGVDLHKITELLVDGDRLIVKTFSGTNSVVVPLDKVVREQD